MINFLNIRRSNGTARRPVKDAFSIVPYTSIADTLWESDSLPISNPAADRAWVEATVEVHCGGEAEVIVAGTPSDPDGYAILCKTTGLGGGFRVFGDSVTGEATAVIARDDDALAALAAGFASLGQAVNFGHYPIADGFPQHLRNAFGHRGWVVTRPSLERAWPSLSLEPGWDAISANMSGSRRQTLKRKWRKAEKLGEVRVEVLAPHPDEVEVLMETAFQVQGRSWKGRTGTALSETPLHARFFQSFGRGAAARGELRMCFLHIGAEVAAMQIATAWGGSFWSISVGYDEAFSACSPGELLTRELIRAAAEGGYRTFEFCGKEAGWTGKWTEEAVDVATLRIYPIRPSGLKALAYDAVRKGGDALIRKSKRPLQPIEAK